jgi:hypothetical protein
MVEVGMTPEVVRTAIRRDALAWFSSHAKIEMKDGEIRRPEPNAHQIKIDRVLKIARKRGVPARIIGLKPRQKGSSTFGVAVGHCRLKSRTGRGLIAGGKHFQGANLFRMLDTYVKTDELDPKSAVVKDMQADYQNGSMMQRITLANGDAGRSGTYQFLLVTEAAYLAEEGVANADKVLDGLVKCVPFVADTIIIVESTANGASGYFFETWETAITMDEFERGKNGYVQVFSAWFEFPDSVMAPEKEGIFSEADYTSAEAEYAAKWGLQMEQVAWMRWAIRDECKGDFDKFQQDYPSDPETAFLRSGRCVFGADGLKYQEAVSALRRPEFGYINHHEESDRVLWVPCDERQAKCVRWEHPRVGCRYLVSVDTMTGEDQTGGKDPDSHAIMVHRAGYMAMNGEWIEPALVMRNMLVPGHKPGSLVCWWNIDVVEAEVYRMARYYKAVIAPEMNMDRGLVELLKLRGDADIYRRRIFNKREQTETEALGWMTDPKTRPMILEKLISEIREAGKGRAGVGYEVRCPWTIKEMKNFGTKKNGRMEALVGHDDSVLSLAIGVTLLDCATPYFEEVRADWMPRDLRGAMERRQQRGHGGTFS